MLLKSDYNHIFLYNGGVPKKYTFRFENISFRFTIVEHFVLRIINKLEKIIYMKKCHSPVFCGIFPHDFPIFHNAHFWHI